MRRFIQTLALLAALAAGASARADAAADIRQVIEAQTAALSAGEARRAFGFASPDIRARFGSSAVFMAMVKAGYSPLIDPAKFEVRTVDVRGDRGMATADVIARDGRAYRAVYPVQRLADGAWRIDGCYLHPAAGRSV